jgi:hypothetical protein
VPEAGRSQVVKRQKDTRLTDPYMLPVSEKGFDKARRWLDAVRLDFTRLY